MHDRDSIDINNSTEGIQDMKLEPKYDILS